MSQLIRHHSPLSALVLLHFSLSWCQICCHARTKQPRQPFPLRRKVSLMRRLGGVLRVRPPSRLTLSYPSRREPRHQRPLTRSQAAPQRLSETTSGTSTAARPRRGSSRKPPSTTRQRGILSDGPSARDSCRTCATHARWILAKGIRVPPELHQEQGPGSQGAPCHPFFDWDPDLVRTAVQHRLHGPSPVVDRVREGAAIATTTSRPTSSVTQPAKRALHPLNEKASLLHLRPEIGEPQPPCRRVDPSCRRVDPSSLGFHGHLLPSLSIQKPWPCDRTHPEYETPEEDGSRHECQIPSERDPFHFRQAGGRTQHGSWSPASPKVHSSSSHSSPNQINLDQAQRISSSLHRDST